MIDLRHLITSLLGLIACASLAIAQTTAPSTQLEKPPAPPVVKPLTSNATAMIIVGASGNAMYERHYRDRATRFATVLKTAGLEADRIHTLSDSSQTATGVIQSMQKIVPTLKPEEQFILIFIGHGATDENSVTLMLAGPDLQMKDVANELSKLRSRSQIVLNFSASAGDASALLAAPGRISIAGAIAGQVNDNDFAEFVLQELEAKPSLNLLDAYNRATARFARWLVRQKQAPAEGPRGWIVEGKESAAIFRKLYEGDDVPPERKFLATNESNKPDAANPPMMADGSAHWMMRRVVTETPSIDDAANGAPVTAIGPRGFEAVAPTNESPVGAVAAKTILGRAN